MYKIYITCIGKSNYYAATFNDETLIERSKMPFYDGARALLAKGLTGPFEMWDHARPYARMRGIIKKAALKEIREDREKGPLVVSYRPNPDFPTERGRRFTQDGKVEDGS